MKKQKRYNFEKIIKAICQRFGTPKISEERIEDIILFMFATENQQDIKSCVAKRISRETAKAILKEIGG